MDVYKNHSSKYIKQKWGKDSNSQITEENWTDLCVIQANPTNSRSWRMEEFSTILTNSQTKCKLNG